MERRCYVSESCHAGHCAISVDKPKETPTQGQVVSPVVGRSQDDKDQ